MEKNEWTSAAKKQKLDDERAAEERKLELFMEQQRRDQLIDKQETGTTRKLVSQMKESGSNESVVGLLSNYQGNTNNTLVIKQLNKGMVLFCIGHLHTIKRNVKNQFHSAEATTERLARVERNQEAIIETITRMEANIEKIAFHVIMDTDSIDNLFPIDSNDSIEAFMSNRDGRFGKRKSELEKLIFSVWTPNITRRQFGDGLMNVLFSRSYIATHRWPHVGYVINY